MYEHLDDIDSVSKEIFRVLKPNGRTLIIDADGLILDLYTKNKTLQKMLDKLKEQISCDIYAGRKIPSSLGSAKFTRIEWKIETVTFRGKNLQDEIKLNRDRLQILKQEFDKILKPKFSADQLIKHYLDEMSNPLTPVFHNKFIVSGVK